MFNEYNPTINRAKTFLWEHYIFWENTVTHPFQTGSVNPSTNAGLEEIVKGINFEEDQVILDVGSGTGAVADVLYRRKGSKTKIICLEINEKFCRYLERKFEEPVKKGDLVIVNGDAADIRKHVSQHVCAGQKKTIVSCLPLMTIDPEKRNTIINEIYLSLACGEMFKQIQYCFKTWEDLFRLMYGYVEITKVPLTSKKPWCWLPLFMFDTYVYACVKQEQKQYVESSFALSM